MGVYLSVFLEYRTRDKEGKPSEWKLTNLYGPRKRLTETVYENNEWVEKSLKPDLVSTDGKEFDSNIEWNYQGSIRDFFSERSFTHGKFTERGLPSDISDELKAVFDKMQKKVEDDVAKGETWCSKWWWGETYCTLDELSSETDKLREKWLSDFEKRIVERESCKHTEGVSAKLDRIIGLLDKDGVPVEDASNNVDEYGEPINAHTYQEYIDELKGDDYWDMMNLNAFVSRISETACEYLDVYNDEDIRIVTYFS